MKSSVTPQSVRVGLIQFPGSNCDWDCADALKRHFDLTPTLIWHRETSLPAMDVLILPGGFSYGDYLRGGALAAHSPIMQAVKTYAEKGGAIIGICNGFQILTESGLLPGVLLKNNSSRFVCKTVGLRVARGSSKLHQSLGASSLRLPVAHGEGRYFIDEAGLQRLEGEGRILLTYDENPNGSVADIAGVISENGRVLGMMPHPERAMDELLGGSDGRRLWQAFLDLAL